MNMPSGVVARLGQSIREKIVVRFRLHFQMPWPYRASLEESDLDALVAGLRTLSSKE